MNSAEKKEEGAFTRRDFIKGDCPREPWGVGDWSGRNGAVGTKCSAEAPTAGWRDTLSGPCSVETVQLRGP